MKKLFIIILTVVIIAGCVEIKSKQNNEIESLDTYDWGKTYYTPNGCEYYIYNNYHGGIPIHKQDCKKCKQHRKAELLEIVGLLKNE